MFTGFTIYKTINKLNPYHVTALFSNYFEISHVGFGWLVGWLVVLDAPGDNRARHSNIEHTESVSEGERDRHRYASKTKVWPSW